MRNCECRTSLALTFNRALPSPATELSAGNLKASPELLHPKTALISFKGCASEAAMVLLAYCPDLSYRAFCLLVCSVGTYVIFQRLREEQECSE